MTVVALVLATLGCDALIGANFDHAASSDGGPDSSAACEPVSACDAGRFADGSSLLADATSDAAGSSDAAVACDTKILDHDEKNCGRCGHDCVGGACIGSVCQPLVLAEGRSAPSDVAVAGGYVYWTDQGTSAQSGKDGKVARVPVLGCAGAPLDAGAPDAATCPTDLATQQPNASGIAVNSEGIYWTEVSTTGSGGVLRLGFDNEPYATFAASQGGPRKIAVDDPNDMNGTPSAYWINGNTGEVRRRYLSGGTTNGSAIITGLSGPVAIALSSTLVCFTVYGADDLSGTVECSNFTGGNHVTISDSQPAPRGLSIGATDVFWVNSGDGTIRMAAPDGSGKKIVLSNRTTPSDIIVSGGTMYWSESGTAPNYEDGTIYAANLDGSGLVKLAGAQHYPLSIAKDATAIYWINRGTTVKDNYDGTVMKVALP